MSEPKFPHVRVTLVGRDGNAWTIIGRVAQEMRRAGVPDDAVNEYRRACFNAVNYKRLLQITAETVTVR